MSTLIKKFHTDTKGAAMLISVMFFLIISMTIVLGIAMPIIKHVHSTLTLIQSKETYYLAEAGLEDALIRLKKNKIVSTGNTFTVNGYTATMNVVSNYNARTVTSTANRGGMIRKMEADVIAGVGASFNYGVQTGNGGFILANSSGVIGNVYSNGDIIGDNGSFITGSAIAANSASLTTDQANGTAGTPANSINFRNAAASQDVAQSFQVSTTSPVNKARFYIKKTGSPGSATVKIMMDSSGSPGTIVVDTATLGDTAGSGAITTSYGWVNATFTSNSELYPGTTYWLVIETATNNTSNYYTLAANSGYATGTAKVGVRSSQTWNNTSPGGLDGYFEIYLGGILSMIDNVDIGTGATGEAHANMVKNSTIAGTLYCQTGSSNNKACNTSKPDPSSVGFPISESNIDFWKEEALEGGVFTGNYNASGTRSIGPMKIDGNFQLTGDITLNGNLWITGNLTGSNGAEMGLASLYEDASGVIIVDGYIDLSNNMQFAGAPGATNSYILLLTTSACPNSSPCAPNSSAIYLGNNAGAVLLNAQNGKLHLKNGSSISEAVAYQIELDPNAVVEYVTGLANVNFSTGPSGGWNINRWQEVQ
jgi:hypothetical protein